MKRERHMCEERDVRRKRKRVSTVMSSRRDQKRKSVTTVIITGPNVFFFFFELISPVTNFSNFSLLTKLVLNLSNDVACNHVRRDGSRGVP